ncbi:MAG: hypothetical protein JNL72_08450 [Flavipsychrobacter sp.]|nr:hypothetical protein [Flavipsychrobacter sp.]
MKFGKLTLLAAIAALSFASCTKDDQQSFICRCTGSTAGPVETYRIDNPSRDAADTQCKGYAQPPAATGTTCALD